jgi:oxygen-dependent protoporphyrinogen oxidase
VPQEGRRILGAVWNSGLFGGRAPAGHELVTVVLGGARDPRAQELSDEEVTRVAASDTMSALETSARPELVSITRYSRAIPQYVAGHEARIEALARAEARWPGLTFLGNYRGGIAVGDVVKNASLTPKAPS